MLNKQRALLWLMTAVKVSFVPNPRSSLMDRRGTMCGKIEHWPATRVETCGWRVCREVGSRSPAAVSGETPEAGGCPSAGTCAYWRPAGVNGQQRSRHSQTPVPLLWMRRATIYTFFIQSFLTWTGDLSNVPRLPPPISAGIGSRPDYR